MDKVSAAYPDVGSDVIESVYQRISSYARMYFEYEPKDKLKRDVYLIKATKSLKMASSLSDLYDLEKVSMFLISPF